MFKFPSAEYNPKLFIGEQAFECCDISITPEQEKQDLYTSADSINFDLEAGLFYRIRWISYGGKINSMNLYQNGEAVPIDKFCWFPDRDTATTECVSPSIKSSSSTTGMPTYTGLLSQEMTGCEISNPASLGFTKTASWSSVSNVYITKFYFMPEESGIYVFSFSSTDYEPELLVGSFGFDCCSKNDGQGLGNSYSSADSKEFYLKAGVYYPMEVLGTGGRPSLAASKDGVAILISSFQWYTPDNLDSAEALISGNDWV
ncbi:hypothetical protein B5S30_g5605 [[Candida] boidinii]|nr:hypothetical protein B5S30_g5605 [[Candida] boidinii]